MVVNRWLRREISQSQTVNSDIFCTSALVLLFHSFFLVVLRFNIAELHVYVRCAHVTDSCLFICVSLHTLSLIVRLHDSISEEGFHYLVFDL